MKYGGGNVVGKHALEEHISYVTRRRVPNRDKRKDNLGKYLDVAVQGYLMRLKNKTIDDPELPF